MKPDAPASITPALTVNEFIGAAVVGTENGVAKLKTDGAELIMTAVAGPVALSIKPSISPMTVPGVIPVVLVKKKSKVSAWPGVDASAIADASVAATKIILFMPAPKWLGRLRRRSSYAVATSREGHRSSRLSAPATAVTLGRTRLRCPKQNVLAVEGQHALARR